MREADDYRSGTGRFGALTASEPLLVEDTGVRDQSASARFQFDLSPTWTLEGRLRSYQAENAGFGFVDPVRLGSTDPTKVRIRIPDQRYDRWSLRLDGAPRRALADALELVAAWQRNDRLLTNLVDLNLGPTIPGAPPSTLSVSSRNTTDLGAQTVRLELSKQLGAKSLWSYGLEWLRETARGTDRSTAVTRLRFPFPPFERVIVQERDLPNLPTAIANHAAIFFQEEHRWGERWKTTAGLRYQRAQMGARPTRGWEVEGLDFEDQELVGTLSVVRQIGTRWQAFASYGTGFRAPNMVELLFQGPTPEGAGFQVRNPNLGSERSTSWDLGLRYRSAPLSLEAVAFRSELRDGIVQAFLSPQEIANLPTGVQQEIQQSGARLVVEQRNLDRLRVEGVELATEFRSSRGFLGGLSFTYLDDQRLSVSAEPLEGLYRERWTWHLSYQPTSASWWLEYRGRYQRGNALPIDPSIPQPVVGFRVPNFDVHSLGFGVRFETRSRLSHQITLRLENLANALYAEAANTAFFRPEPGREWLVAYQLRF
jgi:outer membrane receptor protein involved in Fe transport